MDSNLQLVLASIANAIKARNVELVSGTNIKTVNGNSILGSGDLLIPTSSVVIQTAEPSVPVGNSVLWIETMANGNFNCWIKTG